MSDRKQKIKQAFSNASTTYDHAAVVQHAVAQRVADLIVSGPLAPKPRILEIGCGTGALTRAIKSRLSDADILATDISEQMLVAAARQLNDPSIRFELVDGEQPAPSLGHFDLIASSLTAQWFGDLQGSLKRLSTLLKPGGRMVLSTLGANSFREWRLAYDALGIDCGIPDFPEAAVVSQLLPKCGGGMVTEVETSFTFETAMTFAKSLKLTGAYVPVRNYIPLNPKNFRALIRELGTPLTMSYHVLLIDFVKEQEPHR